MNERLSGSQPVTQRALRLERTAMTEAELRAVLLMHAVEAAPQPAAMPGTANATPAATGWSADDAAWASAQASRELGEQARSSPWLVARARHGLARLAQRDPAWQALAPSLAHAWGGAGWALAALLLAALGLGLGSDLLGGQQRINLLAAPLLGLLLWNAAVYAGLMVSALWSAAGASRHPRTKRSPGAAAWLAKLAAGGWAKLSGHVTGQTLSASASARQLQAAMAQGLADTARATRHLHAWRITAALHAGAAMLALGALLAMYGRGLVLDYRAGWDSTFLSATQVRGLLGGVLGPAAAISGLTLPDASHLATLRWTHDGVAEGAASGTGEPAARWIHLYALTLVGGVLLPRSLLAAWALWRARAGSRDVPLSQDSAYFQALLRQHSSATGTPRTARWPVSVLSYSFALQPAQSAALPAALASALGDGAWPAEPIALPMGAEDALARYLPAEAPGSASGAGLHRQPLADTVAVLFALSATPERETHAALLHALAAALPKRCTLRVLVDASGLRQRLGSVPEAAERLAQRRAAWARLLAEAALPAPQFIDLGAP